MYKKIAAKVNTLRQEFRILRQSGENFPLVFSTILEILDNMTGFMQTGTPFFPLLSSSPSSLYPLIILLVLLIIIKFHFFIVVLALLILSTPCPPLSP